MSVTVRWANSEQTISCLVFKRPWTWDEFYTTYKTAWTMTNSVDHQVDIILDMSHSRPFPVGSLPHLIHHPYRPHANRGVVVVVTPMRGYIETLLNVARRRKLAVVANFYIADNMEDAYATIAAKRHTITKGQ
ncbi:MAG: hypothetical protein CL610_12730 [Anaerolineaceae bacterium]|nr:hypothetical protein [Anaerolineaceae bacterium]